MSSGPKEMNQNARKSPKRQAPQPQKVSATVTPVVATAAAAVSPVVAASVLTIDSTDATAAADPLSFGPSATTMNEGNKIMESESSFEETGGLSDFKKPDHVISRVVSKVEDEIREKISELRKSDPPLKKNSKLEIVSYRSNVVAGFIYFAKIKISGESFVQARILETPKGDILLQSVTETKTIADEEDYFKLAKATQSPDSATVLHPNASVTNDDPSCKELQEALENEFETGGLSKFKPIDHVITRVISKIEEEIKTKINELKKEDPPLDSKTKLEIVGYRSNVVAGFIYFAKIKISGGSSFIQARIFETPKGDVSLQSVTETKTDDDEKEYFKLP